MTNSTNLFFQEVLDKNRLEILEKLKEFKNMWFILWWWTALALIFWHRESIDFDFFIPKNIDNEELFKKIIRIFDWYEVIKTYEENNTIYVLVNDVKLSFFTYDYKNIWNIIETNYFNIYSIDDISAMKMWAIQNRATNKDYVDLYYIIKKIWIKKLIDNFFEKFWKIVTKSYLIKSLVYFDDIIEEKLIIKDKVLNFEKVKKYLEKQAIKN